MTATRRLAAILAADVAGYSRLIGADEGGTLQALKAIRAELLDPTIAAHNGRLVKTTGDGLLIEFGSVVDALRSAGLTLHDMGLPYSLWRNRVGQYRRHPPNWVSIQPALTAALAVSAH
jgi:class 3 adenylate cyclase